MSLMFNKTIYSRYMEIPARLRQVRTDGAEELLRQLRLGVLQGLEALAM